VEEFCDQWLLAWTGNKVERLLNFYADTFTYLDPANPRGISNKSQFKKYLTRLLAKYPTWVWGRQELYLTEKGFLLKWKATLESGKSFYGLDLVELDGMKKITRNEVYFDPTSLYFPPL